MKIKDYSLVIMIIATMSAIISIIAYIVNFGIGFWDNAANWGVLGDFFGGVLNPIFGFSTLILLILTLRQNQEALRQSEEALKINIEELELTRKELADSSKALNAQVKIQRQQSIEDSFFNLLSFHQSLLQSIEVYTFKGDKNHRGNDAFFPLFSEFKSVVTQQDISNDEYYISIDSEITAEEYISTAYSKFFKKNQQKLGHYFRSLYNLFHFIDTSNIDNKGFYINLIADQLSTYELLILHYHLQENKSEEFALLAKEYIIFHNLSSDDLISIDKYQQFLSPVKDMPNSDYDDLFKDIS